MSFSVSARRAAAGILSLCMIFTVGCGGEGTSQSSTTESSSKGITLKHNIESFTVSDGIVYTSELYDSGRVEVIPAVKEDESDIELPIYETRFAAYDLSGSLLKEGVITQSASAAGLTAADNGSTLYFATSDFKSVSLMKYSFGEQEPTIVCTIEDCLLVKRMTMVNGRLFILATSRRQTDTSYTKYTDKGEVLIAADPQTLACETIMPDGIIDLSPEENGSLLIYAHDSNGFYFTKYDAENKVFFRKRIQKSRNDWGADLCRKLPLLLL